MINNRVWFKKKLIVVGFLVACLLIVGFVILSLDLTTTNSDVSTPSSFFTQNNVDKSVDFSEEISSYGEVNTVTYKAEYIILTRDQMIDEADAIIYGIVDNISETRWNQDNGQYWEEITKKDDGETFHAATPFHEIELTILRPIVDEIGLLDKVIITESGRSPIDIDQKIMTNNGIELVSNASHNLEVGDEIIIFLVQDNIAWRNPAKEIEWTTITIDDEPVSYYDVGNRPIIGFISAPSTAYYIRAKDELFYSSSSSVFQEEPLSLAELIQEVDKVRELVE